MCTERESQETEGATATQQGVGSYELLQQQPKQSNETKATLMEQMSRLQRQTSQLCYY